MELRQAIEALKDQKVETRRGGYKFWFGDRDQCRELFKAAFMAVDGSVKEYQHLPEYEEVIDWMTDSQGKGLFLKGSCGRGKTNIITGVIPVLMFQYLGKIIRPYHADDIPDKVKEIARYWSVCLDEVGVEPLVNNYGEKHEGFNTIINAAEAKIAPVFLTSNLSGIQLLERYGERTLDRINRLCRVIEFKGDSLRE